MKGVALMKKVHSTTIKFKVKVKFKIEVKRWSYTGYLMKAEALIYRYPGIIFKPKMSLRRFSEKSCSFWVFSEKVIKNALNAHKVNPRPWENIRWRFEWKNGKNRQERVWRSDPESRPNRQNRRVVSSLPQLGSCSHGIQWRFESKNGENRQKRFWRSDPEDRPNRQYRRVDNTLPHLEWGHIILRDDFSEKMVKIFRNMSDPEYRPNPWFQRTVDVRQWWG